MNYIDIGKKYTDQVIGKIGNLSLRDISNNSLDDDNPEQLYEIKNFLPTLFQDNSEQKYIDALNLALETSYKNGLFQFACVQYHMLFMTSIYFVLLKTHGLYREEMDKALYYLLKDRKNEFFGSENTKNDQLYFGSFAVIGESDVFMLLRVIGLEDTLLGELKKLVQSRNKYAHANGQLLLTSEELFLEKIEQYNEKIKRVFDLLKPSVVKLYTETIVNSDFYDPEIRAYDDPDEQIVEEFIKPYSLSPIELNWLRKIKTSAFKAYEGYEHIKDLHIALCHYYTLLVQDDENYHPIEDIYFHHKYQDRAYEFAEKELGFSKYECVKHGGEFPVYDCPECGHDQLVYDEDADKYHCFHCSENFDGERLIHCSECHTITYKNEMELCPNCIEYKTSKD